MFDNNLANMDRLSKFFHQLIRKKILHDKDFHLTCNYYVAIDFIKTWSYDCAYQSE